MKLQKIFLIFIILVAGFLRFNQLATIPHGLYIDEVSIGYNAYTILQEGKDEYGNTLPLFFKAFGEYKMPVPIYLTAASMALFGKTEFAIRFPSAALGTILVLVLYLFVNALFQTSHQKKNRESTAIIALVSAGLLAISPVAIQFSRGGFEANIALFFYVLGGLFFLNYLQQKDNPSYFFLALSSLILTIYTYNAYRLIAPLTILICLMYSYKKLKKESRRSLFVSIGFIISALIPVILFTLSNDGSQRFIETSAFVQPHLALWQQIFIYPIVYLHNYLSYFSFPFLFTIGDGFGRHTVTDMGNLFRWELPLFLAGCFFLMHNRNTFYARVVLFLLLVAPLAAAFTRPSPHILRSLLLIIPLLVLCGYGTVMLWQKQSKVIRLLLVGLCFFAVYESAYYVHMYAVHYPLRTALDWGGEYKQLVSEASNQQNRYDILVINYNLSGVTSYMNFYNDKLQYQMIDSSWKKPKEWRNKKILYITTEDKKKNSYLQTMPRKLIKNIQSPDRNKTIFAQFWEI